MTIIAKYGVELKFSIPLIKVNDTDFSVTGDWTPGSGDVKISKDGGDFANVDTLPAAVGGTGSVGWEFTVVAAEMQVKTSMIQVVDAALENEAIVIQTYGHASALIVGNFDLLSNLDATISSVVAGEGTSGTVIF